MYHCISWQGCAFVPSYPLELNDVAPNPTEVGAQYRNYRLLFAKLYFHISIGAVHLTFTSPSS